MIDPTTKLAVAESFLQPMGPVASAQLQHLEIVTLLTLIAVVPVLLATPWILWRYRRSKPTGKYRPNWESNRILECLMWGVPILVVFLMGVSLWKMTFRLDPYKELGKDPLQIKVIGLDWKWIFIYPNEADHLDMERVFAHLFVGIETESHDRQADPDESDDDNRHAPHQTFQKFVRLPVRTIFACWFAATIAP